MFSKNFACLLKEEISSLNLIHSGCQNFTYLGPQVGTLCRQNKRNFAEDTIGCLLLLYLVYVLYQSAELKGGNNIMFTFTGSYSKCINSIITTL